MTAPRESMPLLLKSQNSTNELTVTGFSPNVNDTSLGHDVRMNAAATRHADRGHVAVQLDDTLQLHFVFRVHFLNSALLVLVFHYRSCCEIIPVEIYTTCSVIGVANAVVANAVRVQYFVISAIQKQNQVNLAPAAMSAATSMASAWSILLCDKSRRPWSCMSPHNDTKLCFPVCSYLACMSSRLSLIKAAASCIPTALLSRLMLIKARHFVSSAATSRTTEQGLNLASSEKHVFGLLSLGGRVLHLARSFAPFVTFTQREP